MIELKEKQTIKKLYLDGLSKIKIALLTKKSRNTVDNGVVEGASTESVYYENCAAVRAAGATPIYPGDPGIQKKFDRDNDGIGYE